MAKDKLIRVQLAKPERNFIKVYKDFFECKNLTANEKMVYIGLKNYLDFKSDSGAVYPSINTLCDMVGLSNKTVIEALKSLEKKGAIKKERRGITKTNLYTLNDSANMWQAETITQMRKISENAIDLSNEEMIAELERRGAITIIKENELISSTGQSNDISPKAQKTQYRNEYYNTDTSKPQALEERWPMDDIKEHYGYEILLERRPNSENDIDGFMNLLYDLLNTSKDYITISGERKPVNVVWGRLEKLYYEHILYCIDMYNAQTGRIYNQKAYKTKLLYESFDQYNSDMQNKVMNDFYGDGAADQKPEE